VSDNYQRKILPTRPRLFKDVVPPGLREIGDWLEEQGDKLDATLVRVKRVEFPNGGAVEFFPIKDDNSPKQP
jgi:hypothetical protein